MTQKVHKLFMNFKNNLLNLLNCIYQISNQVVGSLTNRQNCRFGSNDSLTSA